MPKQITVEITKLHEILNDRALTQTNLQKMLTDAGFKITISQVNGIVNGKDKNYGIKTASAIAFVLNVKVDDVIEKWEPGQTRENKWIS